MDRNKAVALLFILLMVGSTVGAMVVSIFTKNNDQIQIPTQRVLNYKLSEIQRRTLLSRGFTLVEYEYPDTCFDCEFQKSIMESWTIQSDNQIFLQVTQTTESDTTVDIASFKGSDSLTNPEDDEIKDILCDLIAQRPHWCISIQIE